jgi:hypothetical protein
VELAQSSAVDLKPGARRVLQHGERLQLYESPRTLVGSVYWDDGWNLFSASPDDWRLELRVNGKKAPSAWHELREGDLIESGQWLRLRFRT